LKKSELSFSL